MKFIDWFAGIGGFRRGMELAGHKCVGFCEWDKYASASYRSMHTITEEQREYLSTLDLKKRQKEILKDEYLNGEWYANDIRTVHAGCVPKADCWCFGAPCQDFSFAGARAGLEGDRSSLVREVFRILREMPEEDRPEWLIYENVKGMLSSNRGFDFLAILLELDEGGYDIQWQIFNSKDWGVPQNRERVYTFGHLRTKGSAKIFPIEGADGSDRVQVMQIGRQPGTNRDNPNQGRVYSPDGVSPSLNCMEGGGREPHVAISVINKDCKHQHEHVVDIRGLTRTITARDYKDAQRIAIPVITPDRAEKRQKGRRFKEDGDESFTLTAQDRQGVAVSVDPIGGCKVETQNNASPPSLYIQLSKDCTVYAVWYPKYECYIAIRKLTPKECFRLQGWTDDYFDKAQFVNSDSQLYKQAGNGVTVNVVYEIGRRLKHDEDY